MPIKMFYNPANPAQKYWTALSSDPGVPAGWLDSQGSDGAIPEKLQQFVGGINNQGSGQVGGKYSDGDPGMRTVQPKYPNGFVVGPNYSYSVSNYYGSGVYGIGGYGWGMPNESNVVIS